MSEKKCVGIEQVPCNILNTIKYMISITHDKMMFWLLNHWFMLLLWTCALSIRKSCFWQGVFDGVTGIVRKPIEGAQKEGVEGFFKGTNTLNIAVTENQLYNLLVEMFSRFSWNRCEYFLPSFLVSYRIVVLPVSHLFQGSVRAWLAW